jgi:hypothetical protein
MKQLLALAHRSARYLAQTKEERQAVRGKNASNSSRRRRHKSRRLLAQSDAATLRKMDSHQQAEDFNPGNSQED